MTSSTTFSILGGHIVSFAHIIRFCDTAYMLKAQEIIARRPLTLSDAPVSITAPDTAQVGSDVTITWVGPGAHLDNIQFYRQADNERFDYGYVAGQSEMTFRMPDEPGVFEFRYVFLDNETVHSRPITVTLEKVDAAPAIGPSFLPVVLSVPAAFSGDPILWSAEPLDPQAGAPEALAMPDPITGSWTAELYPGRWRIHAEVIAGRSFGAEITVTNAKGQTFEIPLTPIETIGMVENVPAASGPVPIWIKGQYDGIFTRWQATPVSGQSSEVLGTDYQPHGWKTALDPGRWVIEGFAEGGTGHLYAAALNVTPDASVDVTLLRTASAAQTALTLPNGEPAAAHCLGDVPCSVTDSTGGLRYILLPGWAASAALVYETAGGATAKAASVEFYSGTPLQVMAALNPRQWDVAIGPCTDSALGPLCSAKDTDKAAVVLLKSSLRAVASASGIPGTKLNLKPEVAGALRAKLNGEK
ncbi:hypothetical protein [Cypionkella sinensis]|uniref:Uncharacterized protein n=1 Tax=Cypionkella sinensis TaxID=1756043 RepID=A0ABV7J252_9RHOB